MASGHNQSGDGAAVESGQLLGLKVVDLSRAVAGPHAAMMLGDLGAEVIKVEVPGHGDDSRGWGPPFVGGEYGSRESTYFLSANRNKKSIALDFKSPQDREILLRLIDEADVVIENFHTGVLDRLGLGSALLLERNPRLVILSVTGFGHDGPEGGRAGYDQIAQGEAGLMAITGSAPDDPQKVGTPIADLLAAMNGAYGILAALLERERTGRGQVVRTSLLASVVSALGFQGTRSTVGGEVGRARGNHHPSLCPYGLFPTVDGFVQMAVGSEKLWRDFCAGFGLDPDRPDMATNGLRAANQHAVIGLVSSVFGDWKSADLLERLDELGIPAGQVRQLDDVFAWDQTLSQGLLIDVEHATVGPMRLPGPPLRFFAADGTETTRRSHAAPPPLDHDGPEIRRTLQAGAAS